MRESPSTRAQTMTGFVAIPANPPPAVPPALPATDQVLPGDGWWPSVDLAVLRAAVRIDSNVSPARLRDAALAAILQVRHELAGWRALRELAGAADLAAVHPSLDVAGEDGRTLLYRRAVAALTAAELKETLRDTATAPAGHDRADDLLTTADSHRRDARWAIRDLKAVGRCTVELV